MTTSGVFNWSAFWIFKKNSKKMHSLLLIIFQGRVLSKWTDLKNKTGCVKEKEH